MLIWLIQGAAATKVLKVPEVLRKLNQKFINV